MRLAAIDIGTNSVHMIVVQVRPDLSFEVIDREKEMVRLGAGGLDGKALTESAMAASLQTLSKFKRLAESHQVDEIIASATSATREAVNGGDFLRAIAAETGIRARVITGREEARLIHIAAAYGIDLAGGAGVVVDIGGGSVEITFGSATEVHLARSYKLGVIRTTEGFVKSDPISSGDERRLVEHVRAQITAHVEQVRKRGFQRVIGTSGTILSLGSLAAASEGTTVPPDLRNVRVTAKAFHRLRKRLTAMDLQERLRYPGLDPKRADISVAGVLLFDTILRDLGAEEFTLCDLALREGLVLDYIHRHREQIAQVDQYPDIRRRSIVELGERCNYWPAHAQQVARLALSLFDQTRNLHGLGDREREWLEYSALLHDVGSHISYEGHHKHAYYIITNGGLRGFEPEEIEVMALIARYHRTGRPKKSNAEFDALRKALQKAVRTLSALLSVAESLDRSHAQVVAALDLDERGDHYVLRVRTTSDAELELWALNRHLGALEGVVGRVVRVESLGISQALPVVTTTATAPANGRPAVARKRDRTPRARAGARASKGDGAAGPTDAPSPPTAEQA